MLTGGSGADVLDGRSANAPDKLFGEGGNDQLAGAFAGSAGDILDGGADVDLDHLRIAVGRRQCQPHGTTKGEDKIVNAENAKGGDGDDTLTGGVGPNALFAGPGRRRHGRQGGTTASTAWSATTRCTREGDDVVAGGDGAES